MIRKTERKQRGPLILRFAPYGSAGQSLAANVDANAEGKRDLLHYVDGEGLAHLRAERHKGGDKKKDCLHYCLPGAPDEWNNWLFESVRKPLTAIRGVECMRETGGSFLKADGRAKAE